MNVYILLFLFSSDTMFCDAEAARMSDFTYIPAPGNNEVTNIGFMKMMGQRKSLKPPKHDFSEESSDIHKKIKVSSR